MEDIKLWELNGTQAKSLDLNSRLESEGLLEDTLVENPSLLMDGLILVGRQTPTEGGPLDLLGVDPDGKLVVFELKRGTLSRDAVSQIIDYASYLDSLDIEVLATLITNNSDTPGIDKIEDFQEWYSSERSGELESLTPPRMVLVGLGADDRTERMVRFLAQSDMDISLLTFHAFNYNGKTILAKQVEVEAADEPVRRPTRRRRTQADFEREFDEKMGKHGAHNLVEEVQSMLAGNWPELETRMNSYGRGILLRRGETPKEYARIDVMSGGIVRLVFFPRTKALCLDEFREPVRKIPYTTYKLGRDPIEDPNTEIQFRLTPQEWETNKGSLTTLVQAVHTAWQNQGENDETELLS